LRLQFTTSIGGAYCFCEGAIIEPTTIDPHVQQWLDAGIVVPVRDDETEEAVAEAPEAAARHLRRRRRRPRTSSVA
jgi:hypothetical protein